MDEKQRLALAHLQESKNYRDICPDAVERVFGEALGRYRTLKEADKAARSALHQLTGAFMTAQQLRAARECLERGDLEGALRLHASTRERPNWRKAYERVFSVTGTPPSALDLACGLNPLCLGALGIKTLGLDAHGGAVALVNDWAARARWPLVCRCADLLGDLALPPAHLALMMKLLPVLERQRPGAGAAVLAAAPARWKLVTFPTPTQGGRRVGLAAQYSLWLMDHMPPDHRVAERFESDDECYFVLEDTHA